MSHVTVKLPEIMKAKKKPLEVIELSALGVRVEKQLTTVKYDVPSQRTRGIMVKNAAELVAVLRDRGFTP